MVDSGAAHQIAHTLLARLGLRDVQYSVIIIGLIFGLAMFMKWPLSRRAAAVGIAAEAKIPCPELATSGSSERPPPHFTPPLQPGPRRWRMLTAQILGWFYTTALVMIPSVTGAGLISPKFLGNLERPPS
ncbi:hypothetical protein ACNKHM_08485 [Shigella sonnei]